MFENLIGQKRFVERIQYEIESDQLPSALLFSGEETSGKLTAALEFARVKSCKNFADWQCQCPACCEHRLLAHPKTLVLGKRNFIPEIKAALANAAENDSTYIACLMLIRAVAKLTLRFNSIFEDAGSQIPKKALSLIETLGELLLPLYDNYSEFYVDCQHIGGGWYSDAWAEKIIDLTLNLQGLIPQQISVNEIRAVNYWAHTSGKEKRTVIIDGAESLNSSSANALLKILEESPDGLTFILITNRRGALLSTILSRLRIYDFQTRSKTSQQEVLRRIFRLNDTILYSTIKEYLYQVSGIPLKQFEAFSTELILSLVVDKTSFPENYLEILDLVTDRILLKAFLEILIEVIQSAGREQSDIPYLISADILQNWNCLIRETWIMNNSFNQSIRSLLESLFLRMGKNVSYIQLNNLGGGVL